MFSTNNTKTPFSQPSSSSSTPHPFINNDSINGALWCVMKHLKYFWYLCFSPRYFFFIWLYLDILYTYKSMRNFESLCSFWQDDRGFSWYQNFHFDCLPLFISPWQQILFLFAILIFLYICFLSFTAFSSMFFLQHSLYLLFWPFYLRHQSSFWLFGRVVFFRLFLFCFLICTKSSILFC